MSGSCTEKRGAASRHLTAAVLLFAVFALPFHLHFFTPAAQLTQECGCYHGVRTQAGLAPEPVDRTPTFSIAFLDVFEPQVFSRGAIHDHTIRGPPVFVA